MLEVVIALSAISASIALVAALTLSIHPWAILFAAFLALGVFLARADIYGLAPGPGRSIAFLLFWLGRVLAYACVIGYAGAAWDLGVRYLPFLALSVFASWVFSYLLLPTARSPRRRLSS